jgi:hypothetical protein
VNLALGALLAIVAGFLVARRSGDRVAGAWAGAIAAMPSVLVAVFATAGSTMWQEGTILLPARLAQGLLATAAAVATVGAMLGLALGFVGALAGHLVWRRHDPDYLAYRAALQTMTFQERRSRWIKGELLPIFFVLFLVAALAGVVALPLFLADQLSSWWLNSTLLLGVGFMAVSLVTLFVFRRAVKARLVSHWFACMCGSLGIWLALPGTALEGAAGFLATMVIPFIYMATFFADVSRIMFPPDAVGEDETDDVEEPHPPVLFRDDGMMLMFYPSRRTLAFHALYAGVFGSGLVLVVWQVPALPLPLQWGLGVSGALVLLFGLIPDLIRTLVRWPSLTVTAAGLVDASSAHLIGFGLIPWGQIESVFPAPGKLRRGQFAEVWIVPERLSAVVAALPWWKRPLLKLITMWRVGVPISSLLLAQPPEQVTEQIVAYVKSHAPPEYLESDLDEEEQ